MIGRVAVATLLLGGTVLLTAAPDGITGTFTHRLLLALIVATYASSALFGLRLLRGVRRPAEAAGVVALDLLGIALLLWVTGGPLSVFTVLLAANVVTAAMVVGPRAAWLAAVTSLFVYVALAITSANGWLPPPPDQPRALVGIRDAELGVAILSNTAGLLLIPGLASALAARLDRAGGQLRRASASAARLARLNDDIVRCIASGLVTIDARERIRTINPAGAEILRATEASLLDEPIRRFFPGVELGGADTGARAELTGQRADASRFPIGYSASPLVDLEGHRMGTLLSFQDLTEIKRLRERALREDRLASLGALSAGLAHEIRNPLSSISGSVQLVRESTALDDEDARLLRIVSEEVDRLDELVTTMLSVARPRELRTAKADLGALVADVATMARASAAAREGVSIAVEAEAGVVAEVDADQLRQVVWNLLKNALQVSPSGTRVTLSVSLAPPGHGTIEVRDQGPGLGDEPEERLFDAFFTTRTHGVGLGLALVRQIVDRHQGSVRAANVEGGGASFAIVLPLGEGDASAPRSGRPT
jgi:two-component system sensor histidine kinase PilS (NtrC family)